MRVLITGVTGMVGSHMAEFLLARGDIEVFGTYRWRSKTENLDELKARGLVTVIEGGLAVDDHFQAKHLNLVEANLADAFSMARLVDGIRPDRIFHLAAQSYVPASWREPAETISLNVVGQVNLLEAVRAAGIDPLIHVAGSSEEYGLVYDGEVPIKESNPLRPLSPYAVSKVGQEMLGWQYHRSYGMRIVVTRGFNHTGPRRGDSFVTSNFAKQVAEIEAGLEEPVLYTGDLESRRDWTDVRDMVRAYWMALDDCIPGESYNIGSGTARTVREVLQGVLNRSSVKIEVKQDPARLRPSDVKLLVGDISKFRAATGWSPTIPFEQTMHDLLEYWRNRVAGSAATRPGRVAAGRHPYVTAKRIRFGTDGWRAIIAEDYTFDNVRICAAAVVRFLEDHGLADRGLAVGYDTRFASDRFAQAVAEVVGARGIRVFLSDRPAPTPVVSYSLLDHSAGGGVVITASHNPGSYNGFKYKPEYAGSASPEVVAELERNIDAIQDGGTAPETAPLAELEASGLVERFDPSGPYLAHLRSLIDVDSLAAAGLNVAVDPMHGAGAGYFLKLLGGGSTTVTEINQEPNLSLMDVAPEPIARNLGRLREWVPESGAGVGLALDGDADRLGVVDESGEFVTQLQVFGLLVLYMLEVRGERGAVVRSLTTTAMADKLARQNGVELIETAVGFKYIGPRMMEVDAAIGGEESGGYGFRGHIPERDGILAGLYFLDLMGRLGKSPKELVAYLYEKVGPHHYDRIDLTFPAERRDEIIGSLEARPPSEIDGLEVTKIGRLDGFRYALGDHGWLLIRFSGTEPVLRIYTETDSKERVRPLLDAGRRLTGLDRAVS